MKAEISNNLIIFLIITIVAAFVTFVFNPLMAYVAEQLANYVFSLSLDLSYWQLVCFGILIMVLTNFLKVHIDHERE